MTIKVKAKHIRKGIQFSAKHCPLATAINEATGGSCRVYKFVCALGGNTICLPDAAIKFREVFDYRGKKYVEPFEFELAYEGKP